jgi:integrase
VFRWRATRDRDGKRVEQSKSVGLVNVIGKSEKAAWVEVERLGLNKLITLPKGAVRFSTIAEHYIENELQKKNGMIGRKAGETAARDLHNLRAHLIPRWGHCPAAAILPMEIEGWFESLASSPAGKRGKRSVCLTWATISKIKSIMSQVYSHARRQRLLPADPSSNPMPLVRCRSGSAHEAIVVTPDQMIAILDFLNDEGTRLEWMLALLCSATAIRGVELFGLQWRDVDWERSMIRIRRGWSKGKVTAGKNRQSLTSVALHPVLAACLEEWRAQTAYAKDTDWIFPSDKLRGRKPRSASVAARDYLRPAAIAAGVLPKGDTATRFGWHSLRHSLSTYLADNGVEPAVMMKILRHQRLSTTLEVYTLRVQKSEIAAQGKFLKAIKFDLETEQ